MKVYESKNIRNVALLGHAGSGKTTLGEAMLYQAGNINRRGTVDDNNTVSDFYELEHERNCSVLSTPLYAEYNNTKINIIDTPGFDDYIGEVASATRIADTGIICINVHNGIEVGTENGWEYCQKYNKPVAFVINRLDVDQADFDKSMDELKDRFGHNTVALQYPINAGNGFDSIVDILTKSMYKFTADSNKFEKVDIPDGEKDKVENLYNELMESVAESDEDLMNKFFEEGELTEEEVSKGLKIAILNRQMFPVFCASSKGNVGSVTLMENIVKLLPSPLEMPAEKTIEEEEFPYDSAGTPVLFMYKMLSEQQTGEMLFFKVMSGVMKPSMDLVNEQKNAPERFGQLFVTNGKKREEVAELHAGDIGATVKLKNSGVNHTLHVKGKGITISPIVYPEPRVRVAIVPKTKGEEEKVGMAIHSICNEDPSLQVEHSQELRQMIVYAQGELHLSSTKWRLENRYKVEAEYTEPRVPYRETIQKGIKGSYRHKKQSGGAGQFAEVHMMIEPWTEDGKDFPDFNVRGKDLIELEWGGKLEYVNCIVGGVIDQRFLPAIMKGVMEKMHIGPLTGSYVRDIKMYIYDGKMHPVDSNEAAFKTAGRNVFKDIFTKAQPQILEPVYDVTIKVPEEFVGDVMSDLPGRRGVILGIDSEGRYQKINARMPLAELDKYATALRSMTQAKGTHTQKYAEYQVVPANVQQELIEAYKKSQEEDD